MHELGIMSEAVRMAEEAAGTRTVLKLVLRVGVLSGAAPEALRFAFDVAGRGTRVEKAVLEIENIQAEIWCPVCKRGFQCSQTLDACPECHSFSGDLRHGKELEIAAVELE